MGILSTEQDQNLQTEGGSLLSTESFDTGGVLGTEDGEQITTESGQTLTTEVYVPYTGSSLKTEDGFLLVTESGQELVTEDYEASSGELVGNVFQPDVVLVSSVEVIYDSQWVQQPWVSTYFDVETEYTPPPSTGGQPSVVTTFDTVTSVLPHYPVTDTQGWAEIRVTASAVATVDVAVARPKAAPTTSGGTVHDPEVNPVMREQELQDVMIVSVKMPKPQRFDRFGRPVE